MLELIDYYLQYFSSQFLTRLRVYEAIFNNDLCQYPHGCTIATAANCAIALSVYIIIVAVLCARSHWALLSVIYRPTACGVTASRNQLHCTAPTGVALRVNRILERRRENRRIASRR